jgi:CRP-like cAMP-binding protein
MAEQYKPQQNHLLAALPAEAQSRLFSHLKLIDLPYGKVLYESGDKMRYVYFPVDGIVSLLYVMESGASAEVSVVGNEGFVGMALLLGGDSTPSQAIVQSTGHAYRLAANLFKEELHRHSEMHVLLLRYTQALITQMTQTAVCNRHHSIEQQLCRWLLLCMDRVPGVPLYMTQELMSNMLGVRREGITEAAGNLQRKGAIEYGRGRITVLDRRVIEKLSCECYAVVRKETDRLMPFSTGQVA